MHALGRRGGRRSINIWPGFVDGLATLLLVVIFVLMVFMVAQYFLSTALTGRDLALLRLERQIAELADVLALERAANSELRLNVGQLSENLQSSLVQRQSLSGQLAAIVEERDSLERLVADSESRASRVAAELEDAYKSIEADKEKIEAQLVELAILQSLRDELTAEMAAADSAAEESAEAMAARLAAREAALAEQSSLSTEAQRKVDLLNRQILALREQLSSLQEILDATETENKERRVQIADLTQKLNLALATKVQELKRYRSEFFGRLREVLGNRDDVRVVGDRFVFQSEVLFESASAELEAEGQVQLGQFAETLREISADFPSGIDWIMRVDGHTDERPISTYQFASNWELSAARAISVVKFLVSRGIPAERLTAAGFGQFQPIEQGDSQTAYRRNRRIEFKLTQR